MLNADTAHNQTLLTGVEKNIQIAEQQKPLLTSTVEIASNALKETVDFITAPGNTNFYTMYRNQCVELTTRVDKLAASLKPSRANEENAKQRIEKTLSAVKNLLKISNAAETDLPRASLKAGKAPAAIAATRVRTDRSCTENPCAIIGVVAVVICGIVVPLILNRSIL